MGMELEVLKESTLYLSGWSTMTNGASSTRHGSDPVLLVKSLETSPMNGMLDNGRVAPSIMSPVLMYTPTWR